MLITETSFDTNRHHIHIEFIVTNHDGVEYSVDGILDTGAPKTEFSDQFLFHAGFIESNNGKVILKTGLQTQKYNKIVLPSVVICGHKINNFDVFVSHFEKSWGIDALIGLDFYRRFIITVNYSKGVLITQPFGTITDYIP